MAKKNLIPEEKDIEYGFWEPEVRGGGVEISPIGIIPPEELSKILSTAMEVFSPPPLQGVSASSQSTPATTTPTTTTDWFKNLQFLRYPSLRPQYSFLTPSNPADAYASLYFSPLLGSPLPYQSIARDLLRSFLETPPPRRLGIGQVLKYALLSALPSLVPALGGAIAGALGRDVTPWMATFASTSQAVPTFVEALQRGQEEAEKIYQARLAEAWNKLIGLHELFKPLPVEDEEEAELRKELTRARLQRLKSGDPTAWARFIEDATKETFKEWTANLGNQIKVLQKALEGMPQLSTMFNDYIAGLTYLRLRHNVAVPEELLQPKLKWAEDVVNKFERAIEKAPIKPAEKKSLLDKIKEFRNMFTLPSAPSSTTSPVSPSETPSQRYLITGD